MKKHSGWNFLTVVATNTVILPTVVAPNIIISPTLVAPRVEIIHKQQRNIRTSNTSIFGLNVRGVIKSQIIQLCHTDKTMADGTQWSYSRQLAAAVVLNGCRLRQSKHCRRLSADHGNLLNIYSSKRASIIILRRLGFSSHIEETYWFKFPDSRCTEHNNFTNTCCTACRNNR